MKILIVEDHAVVREGLRRMLSVHFDANVIEAQTADEGVRLIHDERPDVAVIDLNLDGAGGLDVLRRMRERDGKPRVVIFSMHHEPMYAARALSAGAHGYVSKSAPVDELLAAITAVRQGGQYVDRELASRMATGNLADGDPLQSLSVREVEILRLLGQGKSMTAIAADLGIAYKTVANLCTQMKAKLGAERTADLIRYAIDTLK